MNPHIRMHDVAGAVGVPAISIKEIYKSFGRLQALRPVSLDVAPGTVHAFVGQNGAGKSTLLGTIAGRLRPTDGTIEIFGQEETLGSPRYARRAGIVAIYQELTIVPAMTALANVFIGQERKRRGFLDEAEMRRLFLEIQRKLKVEIAMNVRAGSLSVADQQTLEIMRAMVSNPRIILFDEPTTALAPSERRALFSLIRELKDAGHTMIFVSHNLDEVLEISDEVSVFRNGQLTETRCAGDWTKETLVSSMLGANVSGLYRFRPPAKPIDDKHAIAADGITIPGVVQDLAISASEGEIVGIGGLVGSGRTTLLRALAGMEPRSVGKLRMGGKEVQWPRSPREALRHGIALAPEDRKASGLVMGASAMDNICMANFRRVARAGFLRSSEMTRASRHASEPMGFDSERLSAPVGQLSGGNQQKVLLSRWTYQVPRILLIDEPTRGIDIGAKSEILDALRRLADTGMALIVVSSELEELSALADRVIVLSEGRCVDNLRRSEVDISVAAILNSAFGVERHHHND